MPTLPASSSLVIEKPRAAGQYALLRGVPLFAALDDAAADELCGYLHPLELKAGSSLFRVGDAGGDLAAIPILQRSRGGDAVRSGAFLNRPIVGSTQYVRTADTAQAWSVMGTDQTAVPGFLER